MRSSIRFPVVPTSPQLQFLGRDRSHYSLLPLSLSLSPRCRANQSFHQSGCALHSIQYGATVTTETFFPRAKRPLFVIVGREGKGLIWNLPSLPLAWNGCRMVWHMRACANRHHTLSYCTLPTNSAKTNFTFTKATAHPSFLSYHKSDHDLFVHQRTTHSHT